jgi:hypothetical protein
MINGLALMQSDVPNVPTGALAAMGTGIMLVYFAILLITVISLWKIFTKAGKPGWAAIIPIYNIIVLLEIVNKPIWWIVLFLIPLVNFIAWILVSLALAERFGKGVGFGLGIAFLGFIFLPLLAFSDSGMSPATA